MVRMIVPRCGCFAASATTDSRKHGMVGRSSVFTISVSPTAVCVFGKTKVFQAFCHRQMDRLVKKPKSRGAKILNTKIADSQ